MKLILKDNENTSISSSKMPYRSEIDGLRALAVVSVIINHFNKKILPSGYLGVDIFFTISGFVITASLTGRPDQKFGDFMVGFYTKRIKRLMPALILYVAILSVIICLFNPSPGEHLQTGITALFGFSNLFLLSNSTDYFATSTELNPFTHTWSLGVEEQFYFLFPLLVWVTGFHRLNAKSSDQLLGLFCVLSVASLIGFIYFYQADQSSAYFLMPTRLWEMGMGCLLFVGLKHFPKLSRVLQRIPPLLVTAAIVGVMFCPMRYAVPATVAVVMLTGVLIACLRSGTLTYKLFTNHRVVYIGIISYSLYLWHWGVLSVSRWTIGIYWWSVPFQLALIFLLAIASYRYVETPLRRSDWSAFRWQTIGYGVAASFSTVGFVLTTNLLRHRLYQGGESIYHNNKLYQSLIAKCHHNCSRNAFVFGDSHAGHLGALFGMLHTKDKFSVYLHARGHGISKVRGVASFITPALEKYQSKISSGDIIIISTFSNKGIDRKVAVQYQQAISIATARGASVVIISPMPYFSKIVPAIHCQKSWYRPAFSIPKECTAYVSRSKLKQEMAATNKFISGLSAGHENVFVFDAFSALCPDLQRSCTNMKNGRSLYKDDNHLSSYGAEMLYPDFIAFLRLHNLLTTEDQTLAVPKAPNSR
jgi:peptidoglycan/LPS O-acetylase OafA/YrhL